jgi:hypothetical protein
VIQAETMPSMDTLMDRQQLVGWIVRDAITATGGTYTSAARRWPMAMPTLNRLMNTGNVGLRFYAVAEKNLGLPENLLSMVVDGDIQAIRDAAGPPENPGLTAQLRNYIITALGGESPKRRSVKAK